TLAQSGDGFTFDVTVSNVALDGTAALDLEAFGGSLALQGSIDLSMDVTLHVVFGVDSQGFFIEPTAPGDHLLTLSNISIAGDLHVGGDIGIVSVSISNASLVFDQSVQITLDLTQPSDSEEDGKIRLSDFAAPLSQLFNVGITGDHTQDVTFSATVAIDSSFGSLPPQSFVFTWADVTDPGDFTITGDGVTFLRQQIHNLSVAVDGGVQQLQAQA